MPKKHISAPANVRYSTGNPSFGPSESPCKYTLHTLPTDAATASMRLSLKTAAPAVEQCRPRARHTLSQLSPAAPSTHGWATLAVADGDAPSVRVRVGKLLLVIGVSIGDNVGEGDGVSVRSADAVAVALAVHVAVQDGLVPYVRLCEAV